MKKIFNFLALTALLLVGACQPNLTDKGGFKLYYPGITDIGPSTNMSISPSWHGEKPSEFEITSVALEGAPYVTDCFTVNAQTGTFSVAGTDNLPVGKWSISIACKSAGSRYEFPNIITVNMLPAIPESIKVEPSFISVALADVLEGKDLPTAQIVCEGEHISITSYGIASVQLDGVAIAEWGNKFKMSSTGEFSIVSPQEDLAPGVYTFDFRLTTAVVGKDSEAGIFANALTVDVLAAPTSLVYAPAEGIVEEKVAFTSPVPAFVGSKNDLRFTLKACDSPEVTLDESTGVLSLAENHTLAAGTACKVSITATNALGSKDFNNVYTINVVEYIEPITAFSYDDKDGVVQAVSFSHSVKEIVGGAVTYAFAEDMDEVLKANLNIDVATGAVSAAKGHTIPVGNHTVKVVASNFKGSLTASFTLTVVANPNYFTYVHWGNNLGLTPARNYASQYRFHKGDATLTIPIAESDIPEGRPVKFSKQQNNSNGWTFDETTGTFKASCHTASTLSIIAVTVTVGEGEEAITRSFPMAFHSSIGAVLIEFTPFVVNINPKTGGRSEAAVVTPESSTLTFDFRRSFNFVNLNGPDSHDNGAPDKGGLLTKIWTTYFTAMGKSVNTGARDPFSYYVNKNNVSQAVGYIDQTTRQLVINPDKFKTEDGYANGVFTGQTPYVVGGGDPASGTQVFTVAAWLDTNF